MTATAARHMVGTRNGRRVMPEPTDGPLFDYWGHETPDGKYHLCGCGDLIPLDAEACATCLMFNEDWTVPDA
jgi:hypothetical protein